MLYRGAGLWPIAGFAASGLEGQVPDHSTFSRNRHGRFRQSNILRHVFETVVRRCMAEGLVGGEGFAVDASLIQADANKQRSVPSHEWRIEDIPARAAHAVRDYLTTLDDAAFGAASNVVPKFISPSDPAAQWTGALRGPAFFAYANNYLIDTANAVILDVEASRAIRQAEVGAARTMIDRTQDRLGLKPERLAADTAYGSAANLGWLVNDKRIIPHIPVIDKSRRNDGTLSRADFSFDTERDVYACPQGKLLTTTGRVHRERTHCIGPASSTAIRVCLSRVAVRPRRSARFRGTSMRRPATSSDRWPAPQPSSNRGTSASGLK